MPDDNFVEGIKKVGEISNNFNSWSLAIIGGSILILVGTSYVRPETRKIRLMYLLFIPGWFFTAYSMFLGNSVSRRIAAGVFTKAEEVRLDVFGKINSDFKSQINMFSSGILFFLCWLVIYLCWWIFSEWKSKT